MNELFAGGMGVVVLIIVLIFAVAWLVLPFIIIAKFNRMIELLEAQDARSALMFFEQNKARLALEERAFKAEE